MSSHYNCHARGFGPTSVKNGSNILRIGNSTSFVGRLAGSGNASTSSFMSVGPYYDGTSLDATPSKSFSSYGSNGFGDDLMESEVYDECIGADGYADGEEDETCENYDPGEYDNNIDQSREEQEEAYDEFSNDLVILDKDGEESYAFRGEQDAEDQEVVHDVSSDGERYEDDYKAYQDSHDNDYYHNDYEDDDTAVDPPQEEAHEENYDYGEDYEAGEDAEYQEGYHDYDKSVDATKEGHQEDLDHFYQEVKEEFHGQQTPEDDCFVVEVIE